MESRASGNPTRTMRFGPVRTPIILALMAAKRNGFFSPTDRCTSPHPPNAHATINGNSSRHIAGSCPGILSVSTTSAAQRQHRGARPTEVPALQTQLKLLRRTFAPRAETEWVRVERPELRMVLADASTPIE